MDWSIPETHLCKQMAAVKLEPQTTLLTCLSCKDSTRQGEFLSSVSPWPNRPFAPLPQVKEDKFDSKPAASKFPLLESFKQVDGKQSSKRNKKLEYNSSRVSPILGGNSQWSSLAVSRSFNPVFGSSKKFYSASVPGSRIASRASSPISRRPSPPRSTTPTPTLGGFASPNGVIDEAKRTKDDLSQEVLQLRAQVENLTRKSQLLEIDLERTTKQLKEAVTIAGEETAKCKAAKEVIKSLTTQLKEMAERVPVGAIAKNSKLNLPGLYANEGNPSPDSAMTQSEDTTSSIASGLLCSVDSKGNVFSRPTIVNGPTTHNNSNGGTIRNRLNTPEISKSVENHHEYPGEWVEQHEPGVYITLTSLPGGGKDLKRVRFSRKRFSERQAERWWAENRGKVYEKYNVRTVDKSNIADGHDRFSR